MPARQRATLSADDYVTGVLDGNRATLARAITLIESSRSDHQALAQQVLQQLLPHTGRSIRLGISGVPGVGKSTFIETLGKHLVSHEHKLAVLTIDPSSSRSGGSILGDKSRMHELSQHPYAFIRPSPTAGTLGGVSRMTRETILLCEAAGFDRIVIESVGVGQSEITLSQMVDFYLLLLLPGAGDELQGIKKGVLEVAHLLAVNKADPDNALPAERAASTYRHAAHIMKPIHPDWQTPVVTCSALHHKGIAEIWQIVEEFTMMMKNNGGWMENRLQQQTDWMWAMFEQRVFGLLNEDDALQQKLTVLQKQIREQSLTPVTASDQLLKHFLGKLAEHPDRQP